MGKTTITMQLSEASVRNAIRELENYKKELLAKVQTYTYRLAERGISVAKSNTGVFSHYITFSVNLSPTTYGCKAVLLANESGTITRQWQTKEGVQSADVSPLLMTEFGSGFKAQNPKNVAGVGQGTFPDQTHAFDSGGWYYQDLEGVWHHSDGFTPTMPMYKAFCEMEQDIVNVALEVFGK